jgi:hypothetical protein
LVIAYCVIVAAGLATCVIHDLWMERRGLEKHRHGK